jgi:hypothetical protein
MTLTLLSATVIPVLAADDAAAGLTAAIGAIIFALLWVVGIVLGAAAYFAPTIVAVLVRGRHLAAVIVLNVFLGWSLVGWVVALALAFMGKGEPGTVVVMPSASPAAAVGPAGSVPALPPLGARSPDGQYWWNGSGWQSVA